MTASKKPSVHSAKAAVTTRIKGLAAAVVSQRKSMETAGAPQEHLAEARALETLFPAQIDVFDAADSTLLRIGFNSAASPNEALAAWPLDAVVEDAKREGWQMMSDRQGRAVWLSLRAEEDLNHIGLSLHEMLRDQVAELIAPMMESARSSRFERYAQTGLRPVDLPRPEGKPDDRWQLYANPEGVRGVPVEELVTSAQRWSLLVSVPDDIESHIDLARLLFVFGWERWEFFMVAQQQALIGLEAAMELAFDTWLMSTGDIPTARKGKERVTLSAVGLRRASLADYSRKHRLRDVSVGDVLLPRTVKELPDGLASAGLLTPWEAARCSLLVDMRNNLVHANFAMQLMERWAADVLDEVTTVINEMWYRSYDRPPPL